MYRNKKNKRQSTFLTYKAKKKNTDRGLRKPERCIVMWMIVEETEIRWPYFDSCLLAPDILEEKTKLLFSFRMFWSHTPWRNHNLRLWAKILIFQISPIYSNTTIYLYSNLNKYLIWIFIIFVSLVIICRNLSPHTVQEGFCLWH